MSRQDLIWCGFHHHLTSRTPTPCCPPPQTHTHAHTHTHTHTAREHDTHTHTHTHTQRERERWDEMCRGAPRGRRNDRSWSMRPCSGPLRLGARGWDEREEGGRGERQRPTDCKVDRKKDLRNDIVSRAARVCTSSCMLVNMPFDRFQLTPPLLNSQGYAF